MRSAVRGEPGTTDERGVFTALVLLLKSARDLWGLERERSSREGKVTRECTLNAKPYWVAACRVLDRGGDLVLSYNNYIQNLRTFRKSVEIPFWVCVRL